MLLETLFLHLQCYEFQAEIDLNISRSWSQVRYVPNDQSSYKITVYLNVNKLGTDGTVARFKKYEGGSTLHFAHKNFLYVTTSAHTRSRVCRNILSQQEIGRWLFNSTQRLVTVTQIYGWLLMALSSKPCIRYWC